MVQSNETHGGVAQVGGSHYGTKYGHWDYCKDAETGYLEGHATKYLVRWEKKGGIQDLEKALSFVDKIMVGNEETDCDRNTNQYDHLLVRMFEENNVPEPERALIYQIINWKNYQDLYSVRTQLALFIQYHKNLAAGDATASYVNQG